MRKRKRIPFFSGGGARKTSSSQQEERKEGTPSPFPVAQQREGKRRL